MADAAIARSPFALSDSPTQPEMVGKYFRALGDPTRVRILEQSQPKVSNHLACLRWCGFVHTRRDHPTVHYRVAACRRVDSGPC